MIKWENPEHAGVSYVKISSSDQPNDSMIPKNLAVYYATLPAQLVISINEDVIRRAIERAAPPKPADAAAPAASKPVPPQAVQTDSDWLGQSVALQATSEGLRTIQGFYRSELREAMRARSYANLVILNEYRRRFGVKDPVAFHEKLWQVKLLCPGGGHYVWNEEYQTMESSVFGHPAAPTAVAEAPDPLARVESIAGGMTFEDDGLRARVTVRTVKESPRTRIGGE